MRAFYVTVRITDDRGVIFYESREMNALKEEAVIFSPPFTLDEAGDKEYGVFLGFHYSPGIANHPKGARRA